MPAFIENYRFLQLGSSNTRSSTDSVHGAAAKSLSKRFNSNNFDSIWFCCKKKKKEILKMELWNCEYVSGNCAMIDEWDLGWMGWHIQLRLMNCGRRQIYMCFVCFIIIAGNGTRYRLQRWQMRALCLAAQSAHTQYFCFAANSRADTKQKLCLHNFEALAALGSNPIHCCQFTQPDCGKVRALCACVQVISGQTEKCNQIWSLNSSTN